MYGLETITIYNECTRLKNIFVAVKTVASGTKREKWFEETI